VTIRFIFRLPPYAQQVNVRIVKRMDPPTDPRLKGEEGTAPLLCPQCLLRSVYVCQRDEYACRVGHGTIITGEELAAWWRDALVGDV